MSLKNEPERNSICLYMIQVDSFFRSSLRDFEIHDVIYTTNRTSLTGFDFNQLFHISESPEGGSTMNKRL